MDLYKRLIGYPYDGEGFDKIPIYPYISACQMQIAGDCSRGQVVGWLNLTVDEAADHDAVIARMEESVTPLTRHKVEDILNFVEQGWIYTTAEQLQASFGIS